jgi:transposase-like protein
MAQGREWTNEERETIIQSLKPFLEIGLSRNKACESIGLPPQTLSNWVVNDEALGMKLKGWENTLNLLAVSNIASALNKESEMDDAKKETSKWYLERRMKDFSPKQETDVTTNGKDLPTPIMQLDVFSNNSNKENSETI